MHVCSHPANESRFYASCPKTTGPANFYSGLKIGDYDPSCEADVVIGVGTSTGSKYTPVKISIAWLEEKKI